MASQLRSRRNQELIVAEIDRDPEDRCVASGDIAAIREKMLDKTLADSYPASDPPSTLPDPSIDSLRLEASPEPEEWEGHPLRKDYPVEGYR